MSGHMLTEPPERIAMQPIRKAKPPLLPTKPLYINQPLSEQTNNESDTNQSIPSVHHQDQNQSISDHNTNQSIPHQVHAPIKNVRSSEIQSEIDRLRDQQVAFSETVRKNSASVAVTLGVNNNNNTHNHDQMDDSDLTGSGLGPMARRFRQSIRKHSKKRHSVKSYTFHPDHGIRTRLYALSKSFSDLRNAIYNGLGLHRHVDSCIRIQQRVLTRGEWLMMVLFLGTTLAISVAAIVERNPVIPRQASSAGFLLTIYLSVHNSLLDLLLGIPFERRLFWHKLLSVLATWLGALHGALATLKWPACLSPAIAQQLTNQTVVPVGNITLFCPDDCLNYDYTFKMVKSCAPYRQLMMMSGLVLAGFLLLILATSIPSGLRRKKFGLFHVLHLILTTGVTLAAIAHHSWLVIVGVALLLVDMFIRYIYQACSAHPKIAAITALPGDVTRVMLDRPPNFLYSPGQYVFINVPKISPFEWHPFTISSSPHTKMITLHIQALGDWSKQLHKFAGQHNHNTLTDIASIEQSLGERPVSELNRHKAAVPVYIEGPYGESKIDFNAYKVYVLVSGNIGVTPMQALANFLLHQAKKTDRQIVKVYFIWCVSDPSMINSLFEADRRLKAGPLNNWTTNEDDDNEHLHSEIYLTRSRTQVDRDVQKADIPEGLMRSVRFGRPNWPEIFSSIEKTAQDANEKNVAVYACGNSNLVEQINDYCDYRNKFHRRSAQRSKTHQRLRFDVNLEEFEW